MQADCKYYTKPINEAPRCHHERCHERYFRMYPARLLIIKKALETKPREQVIGIFGNRYVRYAERVLRTLDRTAKPDTGNAQPE